MNNKILLDKNGVKFIKLTDDNFNISFTVENSRDVRPLINLNLIKLLYDLNPDLFQAYGVININANEKHICILFKDLFADLSIPQYYYNFSFSVKQDDENTINFQISHRNEIYKNEQDTVPMDAICAPLTHCELVFTLINNTMGEFNITAYINNAELFNSSFFEKMVAMILYKVVNRLKQFISTIT